MKQPAVDARSAAGRPSGKGQFLATAPFRFYLQLPALGFIRCAPVRKEDIMRSLYRSSLIVVLVALLWGAVAPAQSGTAAATVTVTPAQTAFGAATSQSVVITVAAAEVAVGLALIVALYRLRQTTQIQDLTSLKF